LFIWLSNPVREISNPGCESFSTGRFFNLCMEQVFQFLQSVQAMSPALIEYLGSVVKTKELARKDLLLKAGHICQHIYFVEKGLLRCFYVKGETEICSWFMKEKDVMISIESFFQRTTSYESIQALEDSILHYISYDELYYIYRNFPEFNYTGREIIKTYYILCAKQLYGLRMQQAPDRYLWLRENHPELILRVPAKYLASWLGITEVMFSKIKGRNYNILNPGCTGI